MCLEVGGINPSTSTGAPRGDLWAWGWEWEELVPA